MKKQLFREAKSLPGITQVKWKGQELKVALNLIPTHKLFSLAASHGYLTS